MVKTSSVLGGVRFYTRRAFTMIELIFAIVVIGVVMLTIPTMIQVNNKALEGSAAQEAIFLVSAVLSETTTFLWDDNSDDNSTSGSATDIVLSKILDTNGNAAYNRVDANSSVRVGNLHEDRHRRLFDDVKVPAQTTKIQLTQSLTNTASDAVGYKSQYSVVASREYVDDTPNSPFVFAVPAAPIATTTNIKMTQVEINSTIDGTNLVIARLRAYTCNIGEVDYAKRRF